MKREHDHQQQQQHQPSPAAKCDECGGRSTSEERWLLHTVHHKKLNYRHLCTHCVLNCHRSNFCPVCLEVFDPIDAPPRPNQRVMCLNCSSISHLACATATSNSGGHPFQCPPCSNPNFSFFSLKQTNSHKKLKPEKDAFGEANHGNSRGDLEYLRRAIDKDSAKSLVAAAKIAAATLSRAASGARNDAERKAKEAASARKKAREALERVAFLSLREKEREVKACVNGVGLVQEQKMKPRINSSVLEGQNQSQGGDGLSGISVVGSVQEDKGNNGLVSVLPAPAQNPQKNHHG